jgi:hypothetical protein
MYCWWFLILTFFCCVCFVQLYGLTKNL